jgi:uncharacterized protein YndB with AHSA1/START domain
MYDYFHFMQRIEIKEHFPLSVEQLFGHLEVHENLAAIFFPMKVSTVRYGTDQPYGVGSVRKLEVFPVPPFEETITKYAPNELIEYTITKGSPLTHHKGVMQFKEENGGASLFYSIEFDSDIPLLAMVVKIALEAGIKNGLSKLKKGNG